MGGNSDAGNRTSHPGEAGMAGVGWQWRREGGMAGEEGGWDGRGERVGRGQIHPQPHPTMRLHTH